MSWISRTSTVAAAALLAAATASGALAATIVVKSSGPSAKAYPPGKPLADSIQIVLKAGDSVSILDSRGVRTLSGPGSFSPVVTASAGEVRVPRDEVVNKRVRTGAVRSIGVGGGAGPMATEPSWNIWYVDIQRSSTACVADTKDVTMWRPASNHAATVTITGPNGVSQTVEWREGQSRKPWPDALPIANGAQYKLIWAGVAQPLTVKFSMLGPNPTGLDDMASALIRNGCDAQLDLLVETVATPQGGTPPAS